MAKIMVSFDPIDSLDPSAQENSFNQFLFCCLSQCALFVILMIAAMAYSSPLPEPQFGFGYPGGYGGYGGHGGHGGYGGYGGYGGGFGGGYGHHGGHHGHHGHHYG